MNIKKRNHRRARDRRRIDKLSLFQRLSPAESRKARAIAYEAALAIIG